MIFLNRNGFHFVFLTSLLSSFFLFSLFVSDSIGMDLRSEQSLTFPKSIQKNSENANTVKEPVELLGWLNHPAENAFGPLVKALKAGDAASRFQSVWALGKIKNSSERIIFEVLLSSLPDHDPWVHTLIVGSLTGFGVDNRLSEIDISSEVRKVLIFETTHKNPFVRALAIECLFSWRDHADTKTAMHQGFNDSHWLVRNSIVRHHNIDVDLLKKATRDESPNTRVVAIGLLAKFHYDEELEIRDLIIERLRDPVGSVSIKAAHQLAGKQEKRNIKPILDLLNVGRETFVKMVLNTFGELNEIIRDQKWEPNPNFKLDAPIDQLSDDELQRTVRLFETGNPDERLSALFKLTWVDDFSLVRTTFEKAATDPDARVRFALIKNLHSRSTQLRRDKEIVFAKDTAFSLISDANPHVRREAIRVAAFFAEGIEPPFGRLSSENDKELIEILINATDPSEDPFVRLEAVRGLDVDQPDEEIRQLFVSLMKDPFYEVRRNALEKIDLDVFPSGMDAVLSALKDPVSAVRRAALKKFGKTQNRKIFLKDPKFISSVEAMSLNEPDSLTRDEAKDVLRRLKIEGKGTQHK